MVQHYDLAIIGTEVGGLIAGLQLAREGRRVLIVEVDAQKPNDAGVEVSTPMWPMGDVSVIARTHDALGLVQPPGARAATRCGLQICCDPHRVDVDGGRAELARELTRTFPAAAQAIDDFLQRLAQHDRAISQFLAEAPDLPAESWPQRLTLWRCGRAVRNLAKPADAAALDVLYGDIPVDHPLRRMGQAVVELVSTCDAQPPSLMVWMHRLAQALWGGRPPAADRHSLVQMLLKAAERAGISRVAVPPKWQFAARQRQITHLQTAGANEPLRAEVYLYNAAGPLADVLPAGAASAAMAYAPGANVPAAPKQRWGQWQWAVDEAALPAHLGPLTLVVGDLPLRLQCMRPKTDGAQPVPHPGKATVTVTAPLTSAQAEALTQAAQSGERTAGFRAGEGDGEDVNRRLAALILPPLQRLLPYAEALRRLPAGRVLAAPRYTAAHASWGLTGRSRRTGYKNLFYCGADVAPGLDLEGEYLAGLGCVTQLRRQGGWPKP